MASPTPQPGPLEAGSVQQPITGSVTTQFFQGQYNTQNRHVQEQLLGLRPAVAPAPPQPAFNPRQLSNTNAIQFPLVDDNGNVFSHPPPPSQQVTIQGIPAPSPTASNIPAQLQPFRSTYTGFGSSPANVQIIDDTYSGSPGRNLFKRDQSEVEETPKKVAKRDLVMLTDGSVVDDKFFDAKWYDGIAQFGTNDFKKNLSIRRDNLEDEIREHDREPAEGEVMAVQSYCSKCLIEPFQTALVLGWKEVTVATNHGLRGKTSTVCGEF